MRWYFVIILVLLGACNVKQATTAKKRVMVQTMENNGFQFIANEKGDFLLGIKENKATVKIPFNQVRIKLYAVKDNRIVFEDEQRDAKVKWLNNDIIKVRFSNHIKSVLPEDNIAYYTYNVRTGKHQNVYEKQDKADNNSNKQIK